MGLRFEAWTLPWSSSGFQRAIADLPAITGAGTVGYNGTGQTASISLPRDYGRIDELISSTVGTLIRVYDGATLIHEFLAERLERDIDESDAIVVSGADLAAVFDRFIVYPYDYDTNPSTFPNHIYGGRNRIVNAAGDSEPTNETQTITITVESPEHTHLDGAINDSTTTITVDDASIFNVNEFAIVGSERVEITGIAGSDLTVTRGDAGTTAAAHSDFDNIHRIPGGTFTVTYSGQTTAALDFNPDGTAGNDTDDTDLETALEGLSNITAVSVTKTVSKQATSSPDHAGINSADKVFYRAVYEIQFSNPAGDIDQVTVADSIEAGAVVVATTIPGSQGPADPWTTAQHPLTGAEIGSYNTPKIRGSDSGAGEPASSVRINAAGRYAGAQQTVKITPGAVAQASVDVNPTVTGDFRLRLIDKSNNVFAQTASTSCTADTDTTLTITDASVPSDADEILFRVSLVDSDSSAHKPFYINDAKVEEGLGVAKWGKIVGDLMDDAAVDHSGEARGTPLDWVDYSGFTDTVDQDSQAWPRDEALTIHRGMTYGQLFDRGVDFGYEWRLVAKSGTAEYSAGTATHDLEWYIADGLGTDHSGSTTPAINVGQSTLGGPVIYRIPDYTAVLVEGLEGAFVEDTNSTDLSNFGRFETYFGDKAIADSASLTAIGDDLLAEIDSNTQAVKVTIGRNSAHPVPLVDYVPGDNLHVQLPPILDKEVRRVRSITWRHDELTTYDVTASVVLDPETGQAEAVRQLLRKFFPLDDTGIETKPAPEVITTTTGGASLGASITAMRTTNQSIPSGGDIVQWTTYKNVYAFQTPTTTPFLSVLIPRDGYYDVGIHLSWDTFEDGGTVTLIRERGGVDETVWPPSGQDDLWTATDGDRFEGTAHNLHLHEGDAVRLELNPDDASAQNLAEGVMAVYLVDRAAEAACVYRELILSAGPVGYWRLGETSGSTASDETTNGHDGTYEGSITIGETGALANDANTAVSVTEAASGDYVDIGDVADLEFSGTASFSIEAWVKLNEELTDWRVICQKTGFGSSPTGKWLLGTDSDGGVRFRCLRQDGSGTDSAATSADFQNGEWYHVVGTYDGTNIRVYVNGSLEATQASSRSLADSTGDVRIGRGEGNGIGATIDEVALYDRALTQAEIYDHYLCGIGAVI